MVIIIIIIIIINNGLEYLLSLGFLLPSFIEILSFGGFLLNALMVLVEVKVPVEWSNVLGSMIHSDFEFWKVFFECSDRGLSSYI